jgi:hypothetical protein
MDWQSEDLDLGQRCEERAVRFKGAYFKPGVGLVDWPRMKRQ